MELDEMAKTLVERLHLETNPVGVKLIKKEEDIPKDMKMITEPLRYCEMVQAARLRGETTLAKVGMHSCKGGAAGLGLMEFPENISSGNLYFSKLNKCVTKESGSKIVSSFPAQKAESTVATLVAPLDKMKMKPDVVIFIGKPLQARRIVQAALCKEGGRVNIDTAGIQSLCVDATSSPILKGDVNVSMGCDGAAKNAGLEDDFVVVGMPFDMAEKISAILAERGEGWDNWMRS
jgi:uncharacterized protein (DUF169 family)